MKATAMPPATVVPLGWRRRAACRSWPTPDDFHPDPTDWLTAGPWTALGCCSGCGVLQACLDAGRGSQGIWGGLADADRAQVYASGWQLGEPVPALHPDRVWVTLAQAADHLGVPRRRVRGWAERQRVESRFSPLHYGQPTRLVDLDQCRAQLEAA